MQRFRQLTGFGCAIIITFSGAILPCAAVPSTDTRLAILYKAPPPMQESSNGHEGGSSTGAGSRGDDDCPAKPIALTALVPDQSEPVQTATNRPTVWVYVPYTSKDGYSVAFVVQNGAQLKPYSAPVMLPASEGVVGIQWPLNAPILAPKQVYQWSLQITCKKNSSTVSGSIQRVELPTNVRKQLAKTSSPQQQATVYAENGLWYDALTALSTLLQTKADSSAANADWVSLLQQALPKDPTAANNWARLLQKIESKTVNVQKIEP